MTNLLSLDLSTKSTGWAIQTETGVISGVIKCSFTDNRKRIAYMCEEIVKLVKEYNITDIVAEDVRINDFSSKASRTLAWLQGALVFIMYLQNSKIKIEFLGASSWRSKIGIQGYRVQREEQKKKDIAYANQKYGKSLTDSEDDEADALCILAAYQIMLSSQTSEPTKAF